MELLKKMGVTLMFIFCLASLFVSAQEVERVAFAKSYELENNKQYVEAISALKNLKIDTYAVNLRLGWLHYSNNDFKQSILYYAKAIQLRPSSVEARLGYVLPAAKLKLWSSVSAQYDAVLKLDPNNYKANYYRGLMYYNTGNYKAAGPYFQRIESLFPFDYDIVILSAWNSYYLKEMKKAKVLFNQAVLIQPNSQSAKEGLSLCR